MRFPGLSLLGAVELLNKIYFICQVYGVVLISLSIITAILDPIGIGWVLNASNIGFMAP